jgi:hypothetical protein
MIPLHYLDKGILKQLIQSAVEGSNPPSLSKEELSPYLQELAARGVTVRAGYCNQEGRKALVVVSVARRTPVINAEIERILKE